MNSIPKARQEGGEAKKYADEFMCAARILADAMLRIENGDIDMDVDDLREAARMLMPGVGRPPITALRDAVHEMLVCAGEQQITHTCKTLAVNPDMYVRRMRSYLGSAIDSAKSVRDYEQTAFSFYKQLMRVIYNDALEVQE